jgi:hypothetical protein
MKRFLLSVIAVLLLPAAALILYVVGRWSPEDNLSDCIYEAEKLLVHTRSEDTKEKLEKRADLVSSCMNARGFAFDYDGYREMKKKYRASNRTPTSQQEAVELTQRLEMYRLIDVAGDAALWKRNWKRYWPF